ASMLFRLATPKGDYVALRRQVGGVAAAALLAQLIPEAFAAIELPRSMGWDGPLRFVRPLRWLLARHGERAIEFRLGELNSGSVSRGHRTLGAAQFAVGSAAEFPDLWMGQGVMADPVARRKKLKAAAERLLPPGTRLRQDAALEDTLVNLTEFPDAVLGSFDAAYLKSLPTEVLVTVMRDHQKYFALEDAAGNLAPYFVAITNQRGDPQGLIRHGNERVLRARFADAQFFFDADRKLTLAQRLPWLEHVTFQARLGSYRDKSRRISKLARWLAEQWPGTDAAAAAEAAELAKCDLTSDTVKEFTELQGIMGGHYARAEGKPAAIAEAIADQYAWETPPRSNVGAA
ncbi:MAG: glycine--tRNA ligase subunit beta, partial [Terriglobales bacterium]